MGTFAELLDFLYRWQWINILVTFLVIYLTYYFRNVVQKPKIIGKKGPFLKFLIEKCPVLSEYYYPTIWCFGAHAQTVIRAMLRLRPHVPFRR